MQQGSREELFVFTSLTFCLPSCHRESWSDQNVCGRGESQESSASAFYKVRCWLFLYAAAAPPRRGLATCARLQNFPRFLGSSCRGFLTPAPRLGRRPARRSAVRRMRRAEPGCVRDSYIIWTKIRNADQHGKNNRHRTYHPRHWSSLRL